MSVKIIFDDDNVPIAPTLVLATKSGNKIAKITANNISFKDSLNSFSEISFTINKSNIDDSIWDEITDFRLIWVKDWNKWFEIYVDIDESNETKKNISAKSLGEAELSQVNLYGIEINTEADIQRDDYKPTILFNALDPEASLLNRITEKVPHYIISHVDNSISKIQRTFSFDNKSIYDSFQEIAEEINCIFVIECSTDDSGNILREIKVYDLESVCLDCGERAEYFVQCEKCGGTNISHGYGEDTAIFISTENLANNISFSTDNGSVKNCFKLEAGDELMTATIRNINPNGSSYIWYLPKKIKNDMSLSLRTKLNEYDKKYAYYQKDHTVTIDTSIRNAYNSLIEKYKIYTSDYNAVPETLIGYSQIIESYYNTIDFSLYLNDSMMPAPIIMRKTAKEEIKKLTVSNLSPIAVKSLTSVSSATIDSSVLSIAKALIDSRFQVKLSETSYLNGVWRGKFIITSYSDESNTATTNFIICNVTDNYSEFLLQKINKVIKSDYIDDDAMSVIELFKLDNNAFENELKKYSLSRLKSFLNCCQSSVNILIEQGVANNETWADKNPNLYETLYLPYYHKLNIIDNEIQLRENEISIVVGLYGKDGTLDNHGMQSFLENERNTIQKILDFEEYLGKDLFEELSAYRREDTYKNDNYISEGLDNAQLFKNALEFIDVANKDIYKSAMLQHSISASLKNLLVLKEFQPIVDKFKIGNWLRLRVDNKIYKLRLLEYEIDYDNIENLASITFSDVTQITTGITDIESILNQATSISSSYGSVSRQVKINSKTTGEVRDWVKDGLALTKFKIVDSADNQNITWDNHGILCREYLPITDEYDDKQLKIINRGLYVTDDNWLTSRAGIGEFTFWNPKTNQYEDSYGVIADTLVGNLILSENVGVYNQGNSITLDKDGLTIITDDLSQGQNSKVFSVIRKESADSQTNILNLDSNGNLTLDGTININTPNGNSTFNELTDIDRITTEANRIVYDEFYGESGIYSSIQEIYQDSVQYTNTMLNNYKADIGQYLQYDENGLTLGATTSNFKTVIDNQRMAFSNGEDVVAYISNNQLFIPNAVIQTTLSLGNFFFSPHQNGGVSLVWKEN